MERLRIDNIDDEISKPGYTYVVFSVMNCKPCNTINNSVNRLREKYPNIRFCYFSARGLNTKETEERFGVGPVPHSFLFKDGIKQDSVIGRMCAEVMDDWLSKLTTQQEKK